MSLKRKLAQVRTKLGVPSRIRPLPCLDLRDRTTDPIEALFESEFKPAIIEFDLSRCRWHGPTGFRYGPDSIHPYVKTLIEYRLTGRTDYLGSALCRYWDAWQPKNLADALGLDGSGSHNLLYGAPAGHGILPWYGRDSLKWADLKNYHVKWRTYYEEGFSLTRTSGPQCQSFGEARVKHLIDVYEKLRKKGLWRHAPENLDYFDQFPVGDILERDGDAILMVANGQHRLSALSAMGINRGSLIIGVQHRRSPFFVRRDDSDKWPLVRAGIFSREQAVHVFDRIFDGDLPKGCNWMNDIT